MLQHIRTYIYILKVVKEKQSFGGVLMSNAVLMESDTVRECLIGLENVCQFMLTIPVCLFIEKKTPHKTWAEICKLSWAT